LNENKACVVVNVMCVYLVINTSGCFRKEWVWTPCCWAQ